MVASWAQAAAAHARDDLRDSIWADLLDTHALRELAISVFDGHLCITQRLLYGARPYPDVVAFADSFLAEAQRLGAARGRAFAVTLRGEAKLLSGCLDDAEEDLREAARLSRAIGGAIGRGAGAAASGRGRAAPRPPGRGGRAARRGAGRRPRVRRRLPPPRPHLRHHGSPPPPIPPPRWPCSTRPKQRCAARWRPAPDAGSPSPSPPPSPPRAPATSTAPTDTPSRPDAGHGGDAAARLGRRAGGGQGPPRAGQRETAPRPPPASVRRPRASATPASPSTRPGAPHWPPT